MSELLKIWKGTPRYCQMQNARDTQLIAKQAELVENFWATWIKKNQITHQEINDALTQTNKVECLAELNTRFEKHNPEVISPTLATIFLELFDSDIKESEFKNIASMGANPNFKKIYTLARNLGAYYEKDFVSKENIR